MALVVRRNNHLYLDYVSFGVVPLYVDWHWPTLVVLGLRVVSRKWAPVGEIAFEHTTLRKGTSSVQTVRAVLRHRIGIAASAVIGLPILILERHKVARARRLEVAVAGRESQFLEHEGNQQQMLDGPRRNDGHVFERSALSNYQQPSPFPSSPRAHSGR